MITQVLIYRQQVLDKIIRLQQDKQVIREGKFFVEDQVLLHKPWIIKGLLSK